MPVFENSAKCMVKKWAHLVKIIIFGKMMPSEILSFYFTVFSPPQIHPTHILWPIWLRNPFYSVPHLRTWISSKLAPGFMHYDFFLLIFLSGNPHSHFLSACLPSAAATALVTWPCHMFPSTWPIPTQTTNGSAPHSIIMATTVSNRKQRSCLCCVYLSLVSLRFIHRGNHCSSEHRCSR